MHAAGAWTSRILRVLDHVHAHLGDELKPGELAALAGFSLHHFHRIFRGMVGESVMEYVRRRRMDRAAIQLRYGGKPVTEVAFDSGYDSHEGFTRAFHARFGMPPSEFRDSAHRESGELPFHLRQAPARRLLAVRHAGPYDECGKAWGRLLAWAMPNRVMPAGPRLGLCYDDPEAVDPEECRYDACFQIAEEVALPPLPPGFAERRTPPGTDAVALHRGPYDKLGGTYAALFGRWLPYRGLTLADEPVVEVYVNDARGTPSAELLTEIRVRVAEE